MDASQQTPLSSQLAMAKRETEMTNAILAAFDKKQTQEEQDLANRKELALKKTAQKNKDLENLKAELQSKPSGHDIGKQIEIKTNIILQETMMKSLEREKEKLEKEIKDLQKEYKQLTERPKKSEKLKVQLEQRKKERSDLQHNIEEAKRVSDRLTHDINAKEQEKKFLDELYTRIIQRVYFTQNPYE